ncbi:MAG TPA: hypothetical protein VND94_01455 [Terriglobia bacterium]|nr:hypothetical protein [Terriglobia bacterium]
MQVRLRPEHLTTGKTHRQSEAGPKPAARLTCAAAALLVGASGADLFPANYADTCHPVEGGFWRGVGAAAPFSALLWIAILFAIGAW